MKHRLTASIVLIFSLLLTGQALAAQRFEEDLHYFPVIPEQPGAEGDRVQVLEFFWYGCPHCNALEPHINAWLEHKPDYVEFDRIPAMFKRDDVVMHAKAYYALKLMGEASRLQGPIFRAIHEQGTPLKTRDALEAFLGDQGVDLDAFRKAMKSFAVQTQVRRAAVLAERFDVRGVPSLVIDGKYRVDGLEGNTMMQVADYLIERVRKEKSN